MHKLIGSLTPPTAGVSQTETQEAMTAEPTPRTDQACHGFVQANPLKTDVDMWGIQCVDADFARQLERELALAQSRLAEVEKALRRIALGYEGTEGSGVQGFSGTDCADIARAALTTNKGVL